MIKDAVSSHHEEMNLALAVAPEPVAPPATAPADRLRAMFEAHFDFIWRSLRRLGLSDDRADDAAQQVFVIASSKLDAIQPRSERSFLFGTALRVASDIRRSAAFRREVPHADAGEELEGGPRPDDLVEQLDARAMLDRVLESMELELRTVFVLFEIEELSIAEIAELLQIPTGTVSSRLRRAREDFQARIERLQKR